MKTLKTFWLAITLLCGGRLLSAQGSPPGTAGAPAPDCYFSITGITAVGTYGPGGQTSAGTGSAYDNTVTQCAVWHLVYVATSGASSVSIELDAAPLGVSARTPGTFAAMTGAAPSSSNPSTTTGSADIALSPLAVPAFVQVKVGTLNAGTVNVIVLGYRPTATTTPGFGFGSLVFNAPDGTFFAGQQSVTASAVALPTQSSKKFCVKALIGNTINVYLNVTGGTTSNGDELTPGEGRCFTLSNLNLVFVVASTTGASVSWSGEN